MNKLFTVENLSNWIDSTLEDEDEQLKLALKLSLQSAHQKQGTSTQKSSKEVIIIDEDDDEISKEQKDIEKAIQLSLSNVKQNPPKELKSPIISGSGEWFYVNDINPKTPTEGCITFEQLIGDKSQLENVLCSSFSTDLNWLQKQFPRGTPITVCMHYDKSTDKEGHRLIDSNLSVVFPPLFEYGSMHAKFCLFLYKNFIRVVISSANLTEEDWKCLGQCVWFQDFPKKKNPSAPSQCNTNFLEVLKDFLSHFKLSPKFLDKYDFSEAKAYLVSSVAGSKMPQQSYGHLQLRSVLSSHYVKQNNGTQDSIHYQTSSLGSLSSYGWLDRDFLPSVNACAKEAEKENSQNTDNIPALKRKRTPLTKSTPSFHIVYPTKKTVLNSNMDGHQMICLWSKHWEQNAIPRKYLRDAQFTASSRSSLLMHSKVICRTSDNNIQWVYIGSHNLSPSAWGRLQKEGTFKMPNYELGVVLFPEGKTTDSLPFKVPAPDYGPQDEPWIVEKHAPSN